MIARQFKAGFNHHFTIFSPSQFNGNKKTSRKRLVFNVFLVGTGGFEPPTPDTP